MDECKIVSGCKAISLAGRVSHPAQTSVHRRKEAYRLLASDHHRPPVRERTIKSTDYRDPLMVIARVVVSHCTTTRDRDEQNQAPELKDEAG